MKMPGGGPHKVGPGQITDDSEMAMAMLWALTRKEKKEDDKLAQINLNELAFFY